jgi:HPt (histidine-containing phosphotransfer) domain-containing protein
MIMNLKDCYIKFGGDFDEVIGRLRREQLVEKFMYKFLDDKSFDLYQTSMANKDYDEALRAVHTLKGICQNLSFTELYESSREITNALKSNDYEKAIGMTPQLSEDYYRIIHAVEEYRKFMEV